MSLFGWFFHVDKSPTGFTQDSNWGTYYFKFALMRSEPQGIWFFIVGKRALIFQKL